MKHGGLVFTSCVVAFILVVFVLTQIGPKSYRWVDTYSPTDYEPFGCALFDSLMTRTLPRGYQVIDSSITDFKEGNNHSPKSLLLLGNGHISNDEVNSLLNLASRGHKVMVTNSYFSSFRDSLHFQKNYDYNFSFVRLKNEMRKYGRIPQKSIYLPRNNNYPASSVTIPDELLGSTFQTASTNDTLQSLASLNGTDSLLAMRAPWGKGEVILVSTPLIFTNYGTLHPQCRLLVLRLMNELKDRPVYRLYHNPNEAMGVNYDILTFVAEEPPLRFAWQLILTGVALLLAVNARRRQRALPLLERSHNATIDFLSQYASLYRKKTDFGQLLKKRYRCFSIHLWRNFHIDTEDQTPIARRENSERLANFLQRDTFSVMRDLQEIDLLRHSEGYISASLFIGAVKLMRALTPHTHRH